MNLIKCSIVQLHFMSIKNTKWSTNFYFMECVVTVTMLMYIVKDTITGASIYDETPKQTVLKNEKFTLLRHFREISLKTV